jgi:type II secretory pathway pseudopilin PulG
VIAIIGLLSSIVFASLNSARAKAKDASLKEEIKQFTNLMALNYQDYGNYVNFQSTGWIGSAVQCDTAFPDPSISIYTPNARKICSSMYSKAVDLIGYPGYRIYFSNDRNINSYYSIMVGLNNGKWFCSGSSGVTAEYANYGGAYLPSGSGVRGCWGDP